MKKMRISKIIVALLASVVAVTVMTGVAVASPEYIEVLPDGSIGDPENQTELGSPITIDNTGGVTCVDLGFWGYKTISQADQKHVLNLTINPLSGGATANQITLNASERSTIGSSPVPNSASGVGAIQLTWYQDTGGNDAWDYIDLCLNSTGPDGATYELVIDDKGYNSQGVRIDWGLETPELQNVPEFATIAIPAIAVLGLFLFFNKRKQKKA